MRVVIESIPDGEKVVRASEAECEDLYERSLYRIVVNSNAVVTMGKYVGYKEKSNGK